MSFTGTLTSGAVIGRGTVLQPLTVVGAVPPNSKSNCFFIESSSSECFNISVSDEGCFTTNPPGGGGGVTPPTPGGDPGWDFPTLPGGLDIWGLHVQGDKLFLSQDNEILEFEVFLHLNQNTYQSLFKRRNSIAPAGTGIYSLLKHTNTDSLGNFFASTGRWMDDAKGWFVAPVLLSPNTPYLTDGRFLGSEDDTLLIPTTQTPSVTGELTAVEENTAVSLIATLLPTDARELGGVYYSKLGGTAYTRGTFCTFGCCYRKPGTNEAIYYNSIDDTDMVRPTVAQLTPPSGGGLSDFQGSVERVLNVGWYTPNGVFLSGWGTQKNPFYVKTAPDQPNDDLIFTLFIGGTANESASGREYILDRDKRPSSTPGYLGNFVNIARRTYEFGIKPAASVQFSNYRTNSDRDIQVVMDKDLAVIVGKMYSRPGGEEQDGIFYYKYNPEEIKDNTVAELSFKNYPAKWSGRDIALYRGLLLHIVPKQGEDSFSVEAIRLD